MNAAYIHVSSKPQTILESKENPSAAMFHLKICSSWHEKIINYKCLCNYLEEGVQTMITGGIKTLEDDNITVIGTYVRKRFLQYLCAWDLCSCYLGNRKISLTVNRLKLKRNPCACLHFHLQLFCISRLKLMTLQ